MTKTSKEGNEAISDLNEKFLEIMKGRGRIASYLVSPLLHLVKPEETTEIILVKDPNSNRVDGLLIYKTTPVALFDNLSIFRGTNKKFRLKRNLLEKLTKYNFLLDKSNTQDRKLMFEFAKDKTFEENATCIKRKRCKSLKRVLQLPAIVAGFAKRNLSQKSRIQNKKESNIRWFSIGCNDLLTD